ncbi:hypothetical protein F5Y05DRAFT_380507 [Hypoxylon sp. FL0543]|nr:hypothetical protein F5Y05DRAFT_380507 [Hypoxylon sp. FL0543]
MCKEVGFQFPSSLCYYFTVYHTVHYCVLLTARFLTHLKFHHHLNFENLQQKKRMTSQVPTPRQFITSLIDSLASIPTAPGPSSSTAPAGTNPLKLIPPAYRPLLTTLHALYPLTLLPALDLLDRRLATRIRVKPPQSPQDQTPATGTGSARGNEQEKGAAATGSHSFYLVHSAQPRHPRRGHTSSEASPGLSYIVRLDAWNCTCAAFAFAAFPRGDRDQSSCVIDSPSISACFTASVDQSRGKSPREAEWQFGALSSDGTEGSGIAGVPCCKHLLACVLAERWSGLLGGYVDERVVGREEGAGLVADI